MRKIILAGEGKIGEVCLLALQQKFSVDIVSSDNENILRHKRDFDRVISSFDESDCNLVFLAGWYPIISENDLKRKKYINLHGSLLPKYRGLHSIFWMIMNGEAKMGYTIHEATEKVDDGDILYQYEFDYDRQTIGQIHNLFYKDIDKNLAKIMISYIDGTLVLKKQDFSSATWGCKRNLDDCLVDFDMPNLYLRRFFMALTDPYPLPRIIHKGITYEIIDSEIIDREYYCQTARVVNVDDYGVWCKVKDGLLVIKTIRKIGDESSISANRIIRSGYSFVQNKQGIFNTVQFDKKFLSLSYKWLRDREIRKLTMSPRITRKKQQNWFEKLETLTDYKIWGVTYDSKAVGVVGIKHIDRVNQQAEYFGYIGEKDYWKKGIGRLMLDSMTDYAQSIGIKNLILKVAPYNERALKVYAANGFKKQMQNSKIIIMKKNVCQIEF